MSIESAKAFCARMMSDDSFRDSLGSAASAECIAEILKKEEYSFSKNDLLKVISELIGKELKPEDLTQMVCEVYEEEINADGKGSADAVAEWLTTLD